MQDQNNELVTPDYLTKPENSHILNNLLSEHVFSKIDQEKTWHYLTLRRNDAYFKGMHFVAPTLDGGFADFKPVSGSSNLHLHSTANDDFPLDHVVNVYKGDLRKLVAVLGQRQPNITSAPRTKGNESQIRRGKKALRIAQMLRDSWKVDDKNPELVFHLGKSGTTFGYTPYVVDKDKYGTTKEPVYETINVPLGPASFSCPECGIEGDVDEMPYVTESGEEGICPGCGSPLPVQQAPSESLDVQTGEQEFINGATELHIVSGLYVTTPFSVRDLSEVPWLIYQYEEDYGKLLQAFPQLRDKGRIGPLLNEDHQGRTTRDQLSTLTGSAFNYARERPLFSRIWLRPSMFEHLPDDSRHAIKSALPNGMKITAVDGHIVQVEHERIDDVWVECKPEKSEYLWLTGYLDDMIECNEVVDDFIALVIELVMRSVPMNIADPRVIPPEQLREKGRAMAEFIFASRAAGGDFDKAVKQIKASETDPQILNVLSGIIELYRHVTGLTEAVFGGGNYNTAREAELNRNQALAMLAPIWNNIRTFWARVYMNGVRQEARYSAGRFNFPSKPGEGDNSIEIGDLSEVLEGGWVFQADEAMPMTTGQQRDYIMSILELGDPEVRERLGIFHPANISSVDQSLGMPDWEIPGANARFRMLEIINRLLQEQPIPQINPMTGMQDMGPSQQPNPFIFDPVLAVEIVKEWLVSDEASEAEINNEMGYLNVLLYGQAYQAMMAPMGPPPEEGGEPAGPPPEEQNQDLLGPPPEGGAPAPEEQPAT